MCLWKQWKKIRTKYRNLIKLGLSDWAALRLAYTRKAYWHIAGDSLNSALDCTHLGEKKDLLYNKITSKKNKGGA
jgi:hypothetical protein